MTSEDVGSRVFWDTNLFIYLFEDHPQFGQAVTDLRKRMLRRKDRLFTSAMTVGEILVKPVSLRSLAVVERYRKYFSSASLSLASFDLAAAEIYAHIRQDRGIRPPDAIQLACAAAAGVDLFITNDDRLSQKNISGIKFITSLSRAPI